MFDPTRDEARRTFFEAWRKYRAGEPLAGIETLALDVIVQHPEYHRVLGEPERYLDKDYAGEANPFLHMSLHIALEEHPSILQPPAIVGCRLFQRSEEHASELQSLAYLVCRLLLGQKTERHDARP